MYFSALKGVVWIFLVAKGLTSEWMRVRARVVYSGCLATETRLPNRGGWLALIVLSG